MRILCEECKGILIFRKTDKTLFSADETLLNFEYFTQTSLKPHKNFDIW